MTDDLTEQQAEILEWVCRGCPAAEVAVRIGRSPAQVADQVRLIRKKGYDVRLVSAVEARRVANQREALSSPADSQEQG